MLVSRCWRHTLLVPLTLACTPLEGRAPVDASAPVDRPPPADTASVDAVVPSRDDVPEAPRGDARVCPRGESSAVDARISLTLASEMPGSLAYGATARAACLDGAGRVLVAGFCNSCRPATQGTMAAVWRVDAESLRVDASFGESGVSVGSSGSQPVEQWNAITTDASGRIYLGGYAPMNSSRPAVIARLLGNGRLDPSFGREGQVRVERSRFSAMPETGVVVALHHDEAGTVAAVTDQYPWQRQATRSWALRLDAAGLLDATFGEGGIREIDDTHGCFDLARDGDHYVFACSSVRDLPELRRLDGAGRPVDWPVGPRAEARDAPGRFMARTLTRDARGRWLVVGPVSASYADVHAPVAAVRFLPDGSHDRSYGYAGVAFLLGPRQSFLYSFSRASSIACDDRLLVGSDYGSQAAVGFLEAQGRSIESLGDRSNLLLPLRAGSRFAVVQAIVPLPNSSDVIAVTSHTPAAITLHRITQ